MFGRGGQVSIPRIYSLLHISIPWNPWNVSLSKPGMYPEPDQRPRSYSQGNCIHGIRTKMG
jgi:hypothetical protein